ncbi:MAG TPA: hypothetical protein VK447_20940 [Myxococcaceae bacterium]|nr:hypothetical protein [Myxococcaceae bacterium]
MSSPAPHVAIHRYRGHAEGALFAEIRAQLQPLLEKAPRIYIFAEFDPPEHFSYDTEFRNHWAEWFMQNRSRLIKVYMIQSSPLLKLAAMMVNLITGDIITPVPDTAELERLKAQAVASNPS